MSTTHMSGDGASRAANDATLKEWIRLAGSWCRAGGVYLPVYDSPFSQRLQSYFGDAILVRGVHPAVVNTTKHLNTNEELRIGSICFQPSIEKSAAIKGSEARVALSVSASSTLYHHERSVSQLKVMGTARCSHVWVRQLGDLADITMDDMIPWSLYDFYYTPCDTDGSSDSVLGSAILGVMVLGEGG